LRQSLTAEVDQYCRDRTRCAENHSPPPVRRFANEVSYESGRIQDIVGKIYQETDGRPLQEFRIVQFHGQVFKWLAAGRRMRCIQCLKLLGRERQ
jgi:hypothetical protein